MLVLLTLISEGNASANPNHPGKWTAPVQWMSPETLATAVNLVLLPGDGTHHSRVLLWEHDTDAPVVGGIWGWSPPADDSVNAGTFPLSHFANLHLEDPPTVGGTATNIFCAGQTMLADGRLLVTGGSEGGAEVGIRKALLFDPAVDQNGAWSVADSMEFRRWYPDNCLLPDGRVLTVAGSEYPHYAVVGGRAGAPSDTTRRMLQRFGVAKASAWEPSVVPLERDSPFDPLAPVSDAGVADLANNSMLLFGGRDGIGQLSNSATRINRERDPYAPDYAFQWTRLNRDQAGDAAPTPRAGSAVVSIVTSSTVDIVVIGGFDANGASNLAWRGRVSGDLIFWKQLTPSGPASLPALHGHSAVYNPTLNRIFVFGGAGGADDTPTNSTVYSLELGSDRTSPTLIVTQANVSGTPPSGPRSYASLNLDTGPRKGIPLPGWADSSRYRAVLFGGHKEGGGYSDELFALWMYSPTEVVWQQITSTSHPTARAHHGASVDGTSGWLIVSGGETAANTSSSDVWAFDLACGSACGGTGHWESQATLPLAVRGHTAMVLRSEPAFSRLPELFDPGANHWTTLDHSPHWQEWYSFGFLAPRGGSNDELRVFYPGPEDPSSMLHLSAATPYWETVGATLGNWRSGSAVMYRPGKVMKCGTRDTGPDLALGKTASIDLTAATPTWATAAAADEMIGRKNHNLVLLPTGEVIVVGGGRSGPNTNSIDLNCVKMPQIWNPDTLTAGHWYGQEANGIRFDSSSVRRFYHGTAVLLPDGRVLSAGGSNDPGEMQKVNIYSPYYLFDVNNNSSPRVRPVIGSAPKSVAYGERFALCMASTTPALAKVALIRPGATTHGFDQNQRYVPLTVEPTQGGPCAARFLVSAPADSFTAPPGDYMLFALDAAGTPSIASWIRLRATNGSAAHPTVINTLAKICYQSGQVSLQWLPPSVDSATAAQCPGPAAVYEMHYKTGTMSDWVSFAGATPATGLPAPADPGPGQPQSLSVAGLTAGSTYTFRMISKNFRSGSGDWSALSNALTFTTIDEQCGGAGGGGGGGGHEGDPLTVETALAYGLDPPTTGGASDSGYVENTLLANVPSGKLAVDLLPLPDGPRWTTDGARIRLSRTGTQSTRFRGVRLRGVALAAGQSAFAANTEIVAGTLAPAKRVLHADGRDLTASLAAGEAFEGHPGDTLTVEFGDLAPGRIAVETSEAQLVVEPFRTGVDFQCESGGSWQTVAHHDPRNLRAVALYDVPSAGRVRLVFRGDHRLHAVGLFQPGQTAATAAYEPAAVTHSRLGAIGSSLGTDGMILSAGESALVDFTVPFEQMNGLAWFLEVTGEHFSPAGANITMAREGSEESLPVVLALLQNQPNPFNSETRIGFELPQRAHVRVEVFDLAGRRVATLANAAYEPGRHALTWDRRGPAGRVPAGVYTYRLTADGRQLKRQLVVFP